MEPNVLFTGDNLYIMMGINSESIDLIYLDPPFNSKKIYEAPIGSKAKGSTFKDIRTWQDVDEECLHKIYDNYPYLVQYISSIGKMHSKSMMTYIVFMTQRILETYRILKSTGSFYLHCDPTASHYLKIILDKIFGENNFRNEIVWCYRGGGVPKNNFAKRHDIIFRYPKTQDMVFNIDNVRMPYSEESKERLRYTAKAFRGEKIYDNYQANPLGKHPEDWWQIQPIAPSAKERTDYPTQKPLELLKRIIEASSTEGNIVLDPFCGCATTMVAAQQLNRKWIGIDISKKSSDLIKDRFKDDAGLFTDFIHRNDIPIRTDIERITFTPSIRKEIKKKLYDNQEGKCNGCGTEFEIRHFHIDHIIPKSKGGGDYIDNYQLLCGNCNSIKGNRPMEFLNMRLRQLEKTNKYTSFISEIDDFHLKEK